MYDEIGSVLPSLRETGRRELLATGLRVFRNIGFHGSSTRMISREAGMSDAALYAHFPSKEALLYELSEAGHLSALAALEATVEDMRSSSGIDAVAAFLCTFVRWHAMHTHLAGVIQHEFGPLTDEHRAAIVEMRRRIRRLFGAELARGVADGSVAIDSLETVSRALLSWAIDVPRWYDPAGRVSPDELGEQYSELARRMISANWRGHQTPSGRRRS